MKKDKNIHITYQEIDSWEELDSADISLLQKAMDAAEKAYAPYSKFQVGASVMLDNRQVVIGSNQENAAYPSGLCAERVAVFSASSNYPEAKINTLAIYAKSSTNADGQLSPCGSCRQVIHEYEAKQNYPIRVLLMNADFKVLEFSSSVDLLPLAFEFSFSKKG